MAFVKVSLMVFDEPELAPVPVTEFKFRVQLYVVPVVELLNVMFKTPLLQMFCKLGTGDNFGVGLTFKYIVSYLVHPPKVKDIAYLALVIKVFELFNTSEIESEGIK